MNALEEFELKKRILNILKETPKTQEELQEIVGLDLRKILSSLMKFGNLIYVKSSKKYESVIPTFFDLIENDERLSELDKKILTKRILGHAYEDIGKLFEISRETVRLIEKRSIKYLFSEYNLITYSEFEGLILKENYYDFPLLLTSLPKEYLRFLFTLKRIHYSELISANYYFKEIRKLNKIKVKPFKEVIKDKYNLLPPNMKEHVAIVYNPCITEDGFIFFKYNTDVVAHLLKTHGPETPSEISKWNVESKYLINNPDGKNKSISYYRDNILKNKNIIRTEKKLRYYDYDKYKKKIEKIVPKINEVIDSYTQGKLNTYYILKKLKKECESIDIHNKYELHSLIRKLPIENIEVLRSPYIKIMP